jgi:hypothetical protein
MKLKNNNNKIEMKRKEKKNWIEMKKKKKWRKFIGIRIRIAKLKQISVRR